MRRLIMLALVAVNLGLIVVAARQAADPSPLEAWSERPPKPERPDDDR